MNNKKNKGVKPLYDIGRLTKTSIQLPQCVIDEIKKLGVSVSKFCLLAVCEKLGVSVSPIQDKKKRREFIVKYLKNNEKMEKTVSATSFKFAAKQAAKNWDGSKNCVIVSIEDSEGLYNYDELPD